MSATADADTISKVISGIDRYSGKIQDFHVRMLRINATNPRMGGPGEVDRATFLGEFMKAEGFDVHSVNVPDDEARGGYRPNLFAILEGNDTYKTLWYVAHMDTVPEGSAELWQSNPFDPQLKDGKIVARGAEDNGQSLVASLFALRELRRSGVNLPFNVGVSFVSDEEQGSRYGVKHLLKQGHYKRTDLVVVPDSGSADGSDIEIAEKGLIWLKFAVKGKQVHASLPSKGVNARRIGSKLANSLDEFLHNKYDRRNALYHEEPLSTFEPTKVEPNVPNVNTAPGIDVFYFDCRVLPEYRMDEVLSDVKSISKNFERDYNVQVSVDVVQKDDAGPATSEGSEVAVLMKKAVERVVKPRELRLVGIGGQTVGNLFRLEGIPTVVWSTVDDVAHSPNEYCWMKNLVTDAKVFAVLPLIA